MAQITRQAVWRVAAILTVLGANLWAEAPTESQVKAAYLANFGRFVEWPVKVPASFNICVLGPGLVAGDLEAAVAGESIGRAHIVAKKILRPEDAADCRVLFIASEEAYQKKILAVVQRLSVLTVSDMPEFLRHGGMVQFRLDGKRVRFEVNLEATERVGLKLSSELLKLALSVRRKP